MGEGWAEASWMHVHGEKGLQSQILCGCHNLNLLVFFLDFAVYFLYVDDILLMAPSVHCRSCLSFVKMNCFTDLAINIRKSMCIRIGLRCAVARCELLTTDGKDIEWVSDIHYLGIQIVQAGYFKCSFDDAKKSFYRSFNSIYDKIGSRASEEVILSLIKSKCLPCMLYGIEACPLNKTEKTVGISSYPHIYENF
jgi:hypothetical protein